MMAVIPFQVRNQASSLGHSPSPLSNSSGSGSVVNLAARVAQIAVPNELLATTELATAVANAPLRLEPAGKRMLKGFDDPVALASVSRPSP